MVGDIEDVRVAFDEPFDTLSMRDLGRYIVYDSPILHHV